MNWSLQAACAAGTGFILGGILGAREGKAVRFFCMRVVFVFQPVTLLSSACPCWPIKDEPTARSCQCPENALLYNCPSLVKQGMQHVSCLGEFHLMTAWGVGCGDGLVLCHVRKHLWRRAQSPTVAHTEGRGLASLSGWPCNR